ncbi:hypothetical protein Pla163_11360 [Planctomycetes bacterium Pla163]|uniref:Restriction system protein n=1 Tax=Rohdeia mirabilis TaxID=2528008 RepID=A0A518CXU3_9BACT|nr:hypothetical protein Pla163_11360 [Planctomycetes bacterium Pla163]
MARADAADRKRQEKRAKEAHVFAMEAEVERLNAEADSVGEELESILAATLDVDDYVDLESLRIPQNPPPYPSPELAPFDPGPPIPAPPAPPQLSLPPAPTGLGGLLGRGKYKRACELAKSEHEERMRLWERHCQDLDAQLTQRTQLVQAAYVAQATENNRQLDTLINNLAYGVPEAVDEYVSIVLANSVYPDCLDVGHEFSFDPVTAELKLAVMISPPDTVPNRAAYKYTKSKDEITSKELTVKVKKERYASIVHQVALRSLHEVFEADRRGLIKSISLEVVTETIDPATGNDVRIPFVAVATARDPFEDLNLARVTPDASLSHLGASISKNPHDLVPADTSGIRRA